MAPASRARSIRSRWLKAVSMTTGAMRAEVIWAAAAMPSIFGILTSQMTRSGRRSVARATVWTPSAASPTTSKPSSSSISRRSRRMSASSSAMSTRMGSGTGGRAGAAATVDLSNRADTVADKREAPD